MWFPVNAAVALLFTHLISLPLLYYLTQYDKTLIITWDFYNTPSRPLSFRILLDPNGITLLTTVIFISANVLIFTSVYIRDDPNIKRFVALVLSFVFAICLLVILPNLVTLLLGWDGLGLTSYLLVLYYQTPNSQGAAILTAITNRLGDIIILFTIAWRLNTHWLPLQPWSTPSHIMIATLLILAAITKRAQFPFISWLPAAIAAPTPVSALVHSSTLVTAGIFILIRFYPILRNIESLEFILLFAAAITACLAGIAAIVECDIKKVIALSTLSQLGTIIYSLAINIPQLAFFHLVTHALFKALLFIAAGTIIHYHNHGQDLRSVGLLNNTIPLVATILVGASIALCGAPFTAGFYSKDLILEAQINQPINFVLIIIFLTATRLTAAYRTRFLINVLWAPRHSTPTALFQITPDFFTIGPILALAQGALFIGPVISWTIVLPEREVALPLTLKLQAIFAITIGILIGWWLSKPKPRSPSQLIKQPLLNRFLTSLGFTTPINAQATSRPALKAGSKLQKNIDGGWIEALGGQGRLETLKKLTPKLSSATGKSLISNLLTFSLFIIILLLVWE